jgi:uncharacterized membrane protein (UPF0127 family)
MIMTLMNGRTEQRVANVELATTRVERRRGLLGRNAIGPGSALVLAPCCSIHTAFMRFAIDVIFVDGDGRVVRMATRVAPWRIVIASRAFAAIELAAGSLESQPVELGDCLYVRSEDGATAPWSFRGSLSFRRLAAAPAS